MYNWRKKNAHVCTRENKKDASERRIRGRFRWAYIYIYHKCMVAVTVFEVVCVCVCCRTVCCTRRNNVSIGAVFVW